MASGPLVGGSGCGGGGAGGGGREVPRERQRWADKVYTRKIYRGKRDPNSQPQQPQTQPPQQLQPEPSPEQQRDEPPQQQPQKELHQEPQRQQQQLEQTHSQQQQEQTLALLRLQPSQETLATTATPVVLDNGGGGGSPPAIHQPPKDDTGPREPPAHGSESTASDNAPGGLNSISNYNHRADVPTDKTRTFAPSLVGAHQAAADQSNGRPRPRPPFVSYKRDSSGKRRLVVNLASRSRQEVKELHGKLTTELGQVRAMLLQVEECEKRLLEAVASTPPPLAHSLVPVEVGYATLPEYSGNGGVPAMSAPPLALPAGVGYTHAAHPVFPPGNGTANTPMAKRTYTNSEGGGYAAVAARPTMQRQLSVSVGTGLLDTTSISNSMGDLMEKEKRTPKANQYYTNSEFLLAKDKFPPTDSHSKKSKSKTDHGARSGAKPYERAFKSCMSLLSRLMKHRHGWVFNKPVDVKGLGLHDYYTIIRHPMDLGTIKDRLNSNFYSNPREFAEDVRLTFHNAMVYNPKGQDVHVMAEQLLQIFEDRWPSIEAEMAMPMFPTLFTKKVPPPLDMRRILERSASNVRPMWSEPATTPYSYTPQSVRSTALKKPKAKDPNKRDMTFDEKQKLSKNLQSLPLERVEMVVQIIKRRNSALSQHDGEIEVDIDSVDTETLWELDRFVTNYKKSLSKHKRKAEMALQAKLEAERIAQLRNPAPLAIVELQKENDTGGKHGPSSSPVREENRGEKDKEDNESASSSSCSSSSDSGSSSSDSDSDSSSS